MQPDLPSLERPILELTGLEEDSLHLPEAVSQQGLLLLWLQGTGFPSWPLPAGARQAALLQLATSMKLQRTLEDVANVLNSSAIPFLCYKGPALSQAAYGSAHLRPSGDLDLWLDRRDIARAIGALERLDFWPRRPHPPLEVHLRFAYEYALEQAETGVVLELHWQVLPHRYGGSASYSAALARAHTVQLEGQLLPTLSLEDSLVILAAHGAKHLWYRLLWLYDLAGLLQGAKPDWSLVAQIARRSGNHTRVSVALLLLQRIFEKPLPLEWRVSWKARRLAALLLRLRFLPQSQLLAYLILLGLEDGIGGSLRSLLSLALHPSIADISYPQRPLRPHALYYATRPWRYLMSRLKRRPEGSEPGRPAPASPPDGSPPERSSDRGTPPTPA